MEAIFGRRSYGGGGSRGKPASDSQNRSYDSSVWKRRSSHREDNISASVVRMDKIDAEMWEISENLHRADLTVLQRDTQVARWIELQEQKRQSAQVAPKGRRAEVGPDLGLWQNDQYLSRLFNTLGLVRGGEALRIAVCWWRPTP
ncbi:hypothetical protein [Labrys sp. ZIDIC5]|uniref:hypothetical protein n=1 Tax=Labrys sedimenti TaxID=3106036 RepID=UPI002ACAC268|nr:hypothetical protein [Labrys sp. ZIDIC5]MDZ5448621.1 hypothetical protein [Labrys sp. ZIDIC5]